MLNFLFRLVLRNKYGTNSYDLDFVLQFLFSITEKFCLVLTFIPISNNFGFPFNHEF